MVDELLLDTGAFVALIDRSEKRHADCVNVLDNWRGPIVTTEAVVTETLYLVRETKGTKDFLKLRNAEADKVNCGKRHFEALGVPFDVVVSADEV